MELLACVAECASHSVHFLFSYMIHAMGLNIPTLFAGCRVKVASVAGP